jgi:hypothetical protein
MSFEHVSDFFWYSQFAKFGGFIYSLDLLVMYCFLCCFMNST